MKEADKPTTHVWKAGEVTTEAQDGVREVLVSVCGKETPLSPMNARKVILQLRAALRVAETR